MNKSGIFTSPSGEEEQHAYHTRAEQKLDEALTPFQEYIRSQAIASLVLFVCLMSALVWASMPAISTWYDKFTVLPLGIYIGNLHFSGTLEFFVNDILLVLFFFFVGLEIKREFLVGELANWKNATFVVFSAFGGMFVPALLYYLVNYNVSTYYGWGIPMATDTAFALGILSCFKSRMPKNVFTFLAALAIIDDIGAILVIAIFYTTQVNVVMLEIAGLLCLALILTNYLGFRSPWPYLLIGVMMWAAVEAAGIHGTISGILIAFSIPARPKKGPRHLARRLRSLLSYFERRKKDKPLVLEDDKQHTILEEMQDVVKEASTPLQRWEANLELPIALLVLPLFALVNAGVPVSFDLMNAIFVTPASLGILLGLLIGKPVGVLLFSQLALWLKLGNRPANMTIFYMVIIAVITGIGFTMSIFIADLSFGNNEALLDVAKGAVVLSSFVAGIVAAILSGVLVFNDSDASSSELSK